LKISTENSINSSASHLPLHHIYTKREEDEEKDAEKEMERRLSEILLGR